MWPGHTSFEGKNNIALQDSKGNYIVKDELELLKEKRGGVCNRVLAKN